MLFFDMLLLILAAFPTDTGGHRVCGANAFVTLSRLPAGNMACLFMF